MKAADKLIMVVYLVGLTCLLTIFIILPFGLVSYDFSTRLVDGVFRDYKWYYFIGAIILILLNIKLLVALFFDDNVKRMGVIKYTSEGEINISFETIKSLVIKTASEAKGVKDIKVMIKPGKDNINILLKAQIMPDINIPQTIKIVQENVKSYIETIAEIPVGEVKVMITSIVTSTKLRLD
jgi:uncharacterized alkaline shock family protein YloU